MTELHEQTATRTHSGKELSDVISVRIASIVLLWLVSCGDFQKSEKFDRTDYVLKENEKGLR